MKTLLTEWECGAHQGRAHPPKNLKSLSTGRVSHWKAKKKFGYKTSYKNHNWPKRKQSLQLEGKEKY